MTDLGGGNDNDDGGTPDSPVNGSNGRLLSGVPSPSRVSLASGVDGPGSKYAVRNLSHSIDGVNMNNADDSERASVISAPYRSEQGSIFMKLHFCRNVLRTNFFLATKDNISTKG
jgi:hypothetical protein